jgi:tetratricopeptide (TPR) repeat protein
MTALTAVTTIKSPHFRRSLLLICVSFWVGSTAFGLDKKPRVPAANSDDFTEFDEAPPAKAKLAAPTLSPEKRIETLEPKIKKNPKDSKSAIELAHAYYEKKEFAKVTPLLWKFIDELEKTDFYILLRSHNELKQADDLLKVSNLLTSRSPKDFEAFHYQGKAYMMKKKDKEALESYRKAVEANPKYMPSYLSIAEIYDKRKNLYELRSLYQDMLQVFGPLSEIMTRLCQVNTKDGLADQAEKYCRQAIQKDPNIPENHVNLGLVILQTGDKTKAKEIFKTAAEKFPTSEVAKFQYGNFLDDEKNFIDSYKTYKVCVENNATSERCLLGLGNSAFQIQKLGEAHDAYKKLCTINRNYAVHVRRGLASLRTTGSTDWVQKFQELSDYCSM